MNKVKINSERELQSLVIKQLQSKGWAFKKITNMDEMKKFFKETIEKRNKNELLRYGKTHLTNSEFDRLISIIENRHSISGFAQLFLDGKQVISTDGGKDIYLDIFDKKTWCNNDFAVTEEFANNNIRHDLLLLINGLPIANIELKRETVQINNAFNQTQKYSNKLTSLMKFIQIFIISNRIETKYFANNGNINKKFVFNYSDKENNNINDLFHFVNEFLDVCTFSKYISRYIINKTDLGELIALRGYQVHGAEKCIDRLLNSNKNGYLWHATGSGKTITSFKVAQMAANDLEKFDKVVFLVDRKDLDSQTIKEYNSFLQSHEKIDETSNSKALLKQMTSSDSKLIISTMQKMNRLLTTENSRISNSMKQISGIDIVFIIDECHRSQFGEMNQRIKDHFKNARYIGFTGTPIFSDEKNKGEFELTTNDIFDKSIHKYLIQNAIEDKNVLPFYIKYNNNDLNISDHDISDHLSSDNFVRNVSKDILVNFNKRSLNKKFTSLLVVKNINTLIKFYKELKNQQALMLKNDPSYHPIKVAATFSLANDYSDTSIERQEIYEEIIADFNNNTDSNESSIGADSISRYQNRLQFIIKNNNVIPKINLTIVVDQLLTGFDAKKLNTLYVAKQMKKHSLIQALSRTNRIFDNDKETGLIISYVPEMKQKVDEAIKLYSNGLHSESFLVRDAKFYIGEASNIYESLTGINIEKLKENPTENIEQAKEFISKVKKLRDLYNVARTMSEYNDNLIGDNFGMSYMKGLIQATKIIKKTFEETPEWQDLKDKNGVNPFDELDFPIVLEDINRIDENYIRAQLLAAKTKHNNGDYKAQMEIISDIAERMVATEDSLKEVFTEVLTKIKKTPELDVNIALSDELFIKEKEFITKYNATNKEIFEQIHNYYLKERYDEKISNKWIYNRHNSFINMKLPEKFKLKRIEIIKINKDMDTIRKRREIVQGEYEN